MTCNNISNDNDNKNKDQCGATEKSHLIEPRGICFFDKHCMCSKCLPSLLFAVRLSPSVHQKNKAIPAGFFVNSDQVFQHGNSRRKKNFYRNINSRVVR